MKFGKGVLILFIVIQFIGGFSCGSEMTEEELFSSAQDMYSQAEFRDAVHLYEKLVRDFPESIHRPKALFMMGYIYANHLQELDNAKQFYTLLIEDYPDHEFVDDASFEIQNLGKSPEELDKILQERIEKAEAGKKKIK